ncbi:MAG: hypothetical protein RIT27_529 [Pseudomonadota bacterium]|jgi:chromosome segregation ATPase
MLKFISICGGLFFVTSCAISTYECDPSQGGLLGGLQGIHSGCYDQRLSEQQQNLENIRQLQVSAENTQSGLSQEKTLAQNELIRLHNQMDVIDEEITKLSRELNAKQATTKKAEQRKNSLKKKVSNLRGKTQQLRKTISQKPAPDKLQHLQAEERRLKSEVETLKKDLYLDL